MQERLNQMFGFNHKYVVIKDKNNKVLSSGTIKGRKVLSDTLHVNQISADGKFYFNLDSDAFVFEFTNQPVEEIAFDRSLPFKDWYKCEDNLDVDIFRENDETELDEEVELLVKCLNEFDGIETISSCSGHEERPLYVDFIVSQTKPIACIEYLITNKFLGEVILLFDSSRCRNDAEAVLTLKTVDIGEKAYSVAKSLAMELYEMINS